MDIPSLEQILGPAAGTAGGALTAGWIAKTLIQRFLKTNDEKHKSSAEALAKLGKASRLSHDQITEKLTKIATDLAVIKSRMGEVLHIREQVADNGKQIAVSNERIASNSEDIDKGFHSVRRRLDQAEKDVSDLKKIGVAQ
jgi:methyl-accepting chemotaxis protein